MLVSGVRTTYKPGQFVRIQSPGLAQLLGGARRWGDVGVAIKCAWVLIQEFYSSPGVGRSGGVQNLLWKNRYQKFGQFSPTFLTISKKNPGVVVFFQFSSEYMRFEDTNRNTNFPPLCRIHQFFCVPGIRSSKFCSSKVPPPCTHCVGFCIFFSRRCTPTSFRHIWIFSSHILKSNYIFSSTQFLASPPGNK